MRQLCDLMLRNLKIRILFALGLVLTLALIAAGALAQDLVFDCAQLDEFAREGITIYPEEREWYNRNCVEEEEEEEDLPPTPTPTPTPRPPVDTCSQLPADIVVSGYRPFSTQCRRVGAAGVGNAELIAQGVVDAVDVWSNVNAEMQVCFRQEGRLKFLDAATAPRAVSDLPTETFEGMTCGRIDRAGTVVLLQAPETAAVVSDSSSAPEATVPSSITGCQLVTTAYLSLRGGPSISYARILFMPRGTRLVGRARIGDWYMVDYEGQLGWASGTYLEASPDCAGLGDEGAIILPSTAEQPASEAEAPDETNGPAQTGATEQGEQSLTDCQLRTGDILNLREGPGLEYPVLAEIPFQTVLAALARAGDWFKVEYLEQTGWVNIGYVFRSGACG